METVLTFLRELKKNNTREWFQVNKDWYQEAKIAFEDIVAETIKEISAFDNDIGLLSPKDCVFRIYRDVRFSKNKDPYKTHMGAAFCKGGRKSGYAGYYIHVDPDASFSGGGIWQPEPVILKSIRYEILHFPGEFKKIIGEKSFYERFGQMSGEKLKRPPKDFPKDFEDIELLKYKNYIVGNDIHQDKLTSDGFLPFIIDSFQIMSPFIGFLNRCVDHEKKRSFDETYR